ncbi:MAG: rhodanese-like domain-containing protein [Magnetococcus sp. XQGC-1]
MSSQPLSPEQILANALDSEMISVEKLHLLIQNPLPQVVLLDVRTPLEHQQGVIPGSLLFPCDHDLDNLENTAIFRASFHERFRPDLFDPERCYILICRTGPRTAIALENFLRHDLPACELLGGVTEWRQKGFSLQPPAANSAVV